MSELIANLIAKNRALEKRLSYLETQESGGGSSDTAAGILAKLVTVDGSGSGLDADLLDGYHASAFGLLGSANTWTQNNYFSANVGIGTTSPGTPLEVYMTSGTHALRLNTNFGGGNYVDLKPYIYGVSNAGFSLALNGTDRLVLSSSGNVGIGTTSPGERLEVYGNSPAIKIQEDSSSNYYLKMQVNYSGADAVNFIGPFGTTFLQFDPTTGYPVTVGAGGSNYVLLSGNVVTGTGTTPIVALGASPTIAYGIAEQDMIAFHPSLSGGTASNQTSLGALLWSNSVNSARFGRINVALDNPSAYYRSHMSFWTNSGGSANDLTEKMRIAYNGTVSIASPTSGVALQLGRYTGNPNIKSSDSYLLMDSNGAAAGINWYSTDPVILAYGSGSGGGVAIGQTTVSSGYKLEVNGAIKSSAFWYQATSDARIYINAGGMLRFFDGSSSYNLKVGIGITPQGQFHNYNGTGGTVHITQSNITSALLIPNGTGDIAYGAAINWVCRSSAGITQAGIAQLGTPSSGSTDYAMFNAGGNTMIFRIYADGSLYAIRTAGTATFYLSAHITYL